MFDPGQAGFAGFHCGRQVVPAMLGARLDEFEQSYACIGERGNRHIRAVEGFAAFDELLAQKPDALRQFVTGLPPLARYGFECGTEGSDLFAQFLSFGSHEG